jgi:hypothetical protein
MRLLVVIVSVVATFAIPEKVQAHHGIAHNKLEAQKAICKVFGPRCREAMTVVACETGNTFNTRARNGQYLGLFQMGVGERRRFGHGATPLEQAKAAYRYYRLSGWGPWQCKPYGGLLG